MESGRILVDSNKSLSANYTSPAITFDQHYSGCIQAIWTGTPVGTFSLQISLDYEPGGPNSNAPFNAGNWDIYPGTSQTSVGSTSWSWDITATGARWYQLNYVSSSGSGTLTFLYAELK